MSPFTIRYGRKHYRTGPVYAKTFSVTLRHQDREAIEELREYFTAHGHPCSNADVLRWGAEFLLEAKRRQEACATIGPMAPCR